MKPHLAFQRIKLELSLRKYALSLVAFDPLRTPVAKFIVTGVFCGCFVSSVLENLGCKVMVMKMMTHNDPNVRKEALLAVQKLMVHNW